MLEQLRQKYALAAHPEGGYYCQTYASSEQYTSASGLTRSLSTSIYFMLDSESPLSHLHRIESDEIWHFYSGSDEIVVMSVNEKEGYTATRMGASTGVFQHVVKKGDWFGAWLASYYDSFTTSKIEKPDSDKYVLVGCTVAPGFHFDEFELAKGDEFIKTRLQQVELKPHELSVVDRMVHRSSK